MHQITPPGSGNTSQKPDEYAAKTYTLWEQIRSGALWIAIGGAVFLLFWLVEKLHLYY